MNNIAVNIQGFKISVMADGQEIFQGELPQKIFYTRKEMLEKGFTELELDLASHERNQKIAHRVNPLKPKSPIMYNIAEMIKWTERQAKVFAANMR